MKRALIISSCMVIAMVGSSYSNYNQNQTKPQPQKPKTSVTKKTGSTSSASKADIQEGKLLIAKQDCFACHKPNDKVVGPAYADVAKKYPLTEANVNLLSQKVINGGTGVWGQIPMSPHPSLSVTDAKKIVKYILSEYK